MKGDLVFYMGCQNRGTPKMETTREQTHPVETNVITPGTELSSRCDCDVLSCFAVKMWPH